MVMMIKETGMAKKRRITNCRNGGTMILNLNFTLEIIHFLIYNFRYNYLHDAEPVTIPAHIQTCLVWIRFSFACRERLPDFGEPFFYWDKEANYTKPESCHRYGYQTAHRRDAPFRPLERLVCGQQPAPTNAAQPGNLISIGSG